MNTWTKYYFVVLLMIVHISSLRVAAQVLVLSETFDDGDAQDGKPATWGPGAGDGGTRLVVEGDYVMSLDDGISDGMSTLVEEMTGIQDVSIRTQARLLRQGGNTDWIALWARSPSNEDPRAYVGAVSSSGLLITGIGGQDPFETFGTRQTTLDPFNEDVFLQLDVVGDRISFYAWAEGTTKPPAPQLSATNQTLNDGAFIGMSLDSTPNVGDDIAIAAFRSYSVVDVSRAPCDLNIDDECTLEDLEALYAIGNLDQGVNKIVGENDRYDLNGDGNVDARDLDKWLSDAAAENGFSGSYVAGDANLDGRVDSLDLNALGLNWNQPVSAWSGGDFTADGVVDSADLNALALNWLQSIPMASALSAPVPEPSAVFLALVGLASVGRRARRR